VTVREREGINPSNHRWTTFNSRVEAALAIYPAELWTFEVLQRFRAHCPKAIRLRAEQQHIDRLRSWDPAHGFNMNPAHYGTASPECIEAYRQRIRATTTTGTATP